MSIIDKDKNKSVLVLIESPNKKSTLTQLFKEIGYTKFKIEASIGHITEIADDPKSYWNTGIYPDKKFKVNYKVTANKKQTVEILKELAKKADIIYLMTDPDYEGFAISYTLYEELQLKANYRRILIHEITKPALIKGINESQIDLGLTIVAAARSRAVLDKIVGYRISPIARKEVDAKSVGRCQSAGLKLIVSREEEIQNFIPETYFDLFLYFSKNNIEFKAKFIGEADAQIDKIKDKNYCDYIIKSCPLNNFKINSINCKQGYENPKPPFTTSTYQQEVSKKLGISVKQAMDYAQKLFEGLEINGKHIALTTYLRTDSTEMSEDFKPILATYIKNNFGVKYYAPVRSGKKSENAQEGHECFRVCDVEMTPEKLSKYIHDDKLLKIYTIIWKRTVAASMASAITSNTEYLITNNEFKFSLKSKEYLFDGYRAVYNYKDDDVKEDFVKETFNLNETLQNTRLESVEQQTKPPARYKEATFIKELESKGIGRPSTFATIVETLLSESRGYCKIEDKLIVPTEKGIKLSHFLDQAFGDIININYTNELEKDLDLIATGKLDSIEFLTNFYNNLEASANKFYKTPKTTKEVPKNTPKCPKCGKKMILKHGPYSDFWGCSNYPKCTGTLSFTQKK